MLQKIMFHFVGSDFPDWFHVEDINAIPDSLTPNRKDALASIELDVLLTSAQDINDLMFKLSKLQELFEPLTDFDKTCQQLRDGEAIRFPKNTPCSFPPEK